MYYIKYHTLEKHEKREIREKADLTEANEENEGKPPMNRTTPTASFIPAWGGAPGNAIENIWSANGAFQALGGGRLIDAVI